ncbi:hypothetical protein EDC04DRAFT_2954360 [Pisolithus marmoratus]|nr:hypothetical protein EDC04DRAFT_2954360 [Pisolithus marmoratus]
MESNRESLLVALHLPAGLDDEELSRSVSDLVSLAVGGTQSAKVTLQELADAEPLTILPNLLSSSDDHAQELVRACGIGSSAKEIMIVVQEAIEELRWYYHVGDEETQEKPITAPSSPSSSITQSDQRIPRLRLGKRTPFQLAGPIVLDISSLVPSAAQDASQREGRLLLREIACLVRALQPWASASASEDDLGQIKVRSNVTWLLVDISISRSSYYFRNYSRDLLDATVVAEFERLFPPLDCEIGSPKGWEDGQRVMREIQDALTILGTFPEPPGTESTSDLIYLAHAEPAVPLSLANLTQLHPLLVNSLQRNVATDETLFLLLRLLAQESRQSDATEIPPDIANSLCSVLSALASTHLDPFMRHLNLRLLSMVLPKFTQPSDSTFC